MQALAKVVVACVVAWGGYAGYTGSKLNDLAAQEIEWHVQEGREIKAQQMQIDNLQHEILLKK